MAPRSSTAGSGKPTRCTAGANSMALTASIGGNSCALSVLQKTWCFFVLQNTEKYIVCQLYVQPE